MGLLDTGVFLFYRFKCGIICAFFSFHSFRAETIQVACIYRWNIGRNPPSICSNFFSFDLGQPFRFWKVLVPWYFNPYSVVSWGSWLLTIYPIALLIYCWYMFKENEKMIKIFGISTLPLAIGVHGYTGFVFGLIQARVYWYSAVMPGYFLTSAVLSGIGLVIIITLIKDKLLGGSTLSELFTPLKRMMIVIIMLDLFWIFAGKLHFYQAQMKLVLLHLFL